MARNIAIRYSFVDIPDGTRYHRSAVPLLGGVAFTASVFFAWLITHIVTALQFETAELLLVLGFLLSFVLGVYDDRNGMKARWKLLSQFVCGLFLVIGCYAGNWVSTAFLFPFLLVWVVGIMNAMNFLDNMDGIASGVTGLASLAFVLLLALHGQSAGAVIAGATCGASIGFLRYNFPPAKIFLGDAGSLPMGYLLGALSIMTAGATGLPAMIAPLIVLGYPVFDIVFVTIIRIREHRRFYQGGRDHSSHRLASLPLSPRKTALLLYAFCLGLAGTALLVDSLNRFSSSILALAILAVCFLILGLRLSRLGSGATSHEPATK